MRARHGRIDNIRVTGPPAAECKPQQTTTASDLHQILVMEFQMEVVLKNLIIKINLPLK